MNQKKIEFRALRQILIEYSFSKNEFRVNMNGIKRKFRIFAKKIMMIDDKVNEYLSRHNYPAFELKAVFFDMDGVLFDSMKLHAPAWVKAMNESGLPFSEYDGYMNEGRTGASTIDGVFEKVHGRLSTEDEKATIYSLKSKYFEASGQPERMPYAAELLLKIKRDGFEIFLVTGSGQVSLLKGLEEHFPGIFFPEKMVTAFDVNQGKPHPEPYLTALSKSKLQPWQVVVIENAPLGVESATKAGIFTIAANTGPLDNKVLSDSGAAVVFDSIQEIYEKWDSVVRSLNTIH